MRETPILIIGAGPSGLTLALELHLHSIPFTIIDSLQTPSSHSRALVLHPRTLELLSRHEGVVEKCIFKGKLNPAVRMYANQKLVFDMEVGDVGGNDTRFKGPLMISQAETEEILEDSLKERGVKVERGVSAESCAEVEGGVVVKLRKGEGEVEEIRFQYIIGCDGAHSVVRKAAGLKFSGAAYPQDFVLADLHLKWEHKDCLTVFLGSSGFMAVFPLPDNIFRVLCSRIQEKDNDDEPTMKDFEDCFRELVPGDVEIWGEVWISRFRLHHRIVENYRRGRMFMVGDAAHIHSPAGGQGMNTGMQDSVNLGWKLAAVVKGEKEDGFLDSYDGERHRIGENLLRSTDRAFEFMAMSNWLWAGLRNWLIPWVVPWVMSTREVRRKRFRWVSMLGIRYRHSAIVGQARSWKGVVRGGDRAPDGRLVGEEGKASLHLLIRGPRHHLVLFSGIREGAVDEATLEAAAEGFAHDGNESVKIHKIFDTPSKSASYVDEDGEVHGLFGFKESGYVMIRPDGHVSFIRPLNAMDELKVWVKK